MTYRVDDTIAAIASAPGSAARGIVRISGPETLACLIKCFHTTTPTDLAVLTRASVVAGSMRLDDGQTLLPCELYFWPTKHSYTRQISAELHTCGSPPLLDSLLNELCHHGVRLAQPGEFTLRAFLSGRIDLTQAEAVLGVIDATDSQTLDIALSQLAGGLAGPLAILQSELLDLLADLEAGLDFADEDIAFTTSEAAQHQLDIAQTTLHDVRSQLASRGLARGERRVVLRGWPNVGKSSLINALTENAVAIVSPQPGTTRDYVTYRFQWGSIEGVLIDTAGFEPDNAPNSLAGAAQKMATGQLQQADLELLCLDATRPLNEWERATLAQAATVPRQIVWTKTDRRSAETEISGEPLETSSLTGQGIELLRQRIGQHIQEADSPATLVIASTAQRCRASLEAADTHVRNALQLLVQQQGHELVALELREAIDHVGQVVGTVYTDDILDRVFQRFCIGK